MRLEASSDMLPISVVTDDPDPLAPTLGADSSEPPLVHQLKVTLGDVRPPVWRRLLVPSSMTLGELHEVLQMAFGWHDDRGHEFAAGKARYGPEEIRTPIRELLGPLVQNEDAARLDRVAPRPGSIVHYTYQPGLLGRHRIDVESLLPADVTRIYPACADGRGLPPMEDTRAAHPGRFTEAARQQLDVGLSRAPWAVRGRDLRERATDSVVDVVFAGLMPSLSGSGSGPGEVCSCGEIHDAQLLGPLRPFRPQPEAVLAAEIATVPLVADVVGLVAWMGGTRTVTPSGLLRPADAAAAVTQLRLGDRPPTGKRVVSAKRLPELHALWSGAVEAGLIEVRGTKATVTGRVRLWQDDVPAPERVETWARLMSGYLRGRQESAELDRHFTSLTGNQEILAASAPLYYALAKTPAPPALLVGAVLGAETAESADLDDLLWSFRSVPEGLRDAAQQWLRLGVLRPVTTDELAPPLVEEWAARTGELQAMLTGALTGVGLNAAAFVDALERTPTVQLTALGDYGLRRLLLAHGFSVPVLGALAGTAPGEFLDRLGEYPPEDTEDEMRVWLQARGPEADQALRAVAESARVDDVAVGPARRNTLSTVLAAMGPTIQPLLATLHNDAWLGPVAAHVRHQLGLGPEPTLAQIIWLGLDDLSQYLDAPVELRADLVAETPLPALLAHPGALASAMREPHPYLRETLLLVADGTDDPQLAALLRRAVGMGVGSRRPARKKGKQRRKR
jgi:Plasmid pRiA4b ORF-3-like protein